MKLQKRDGREVEFDRELIGKAVYNAAMSCGIAKWESYELGCKVSKSVADKFADIEVVNVEDVQDAVEYKLMCSKYKKDVAKSYIEYRAERCRARESKNKLKTQIEKLFDQNNLEVSLENSNKAAEVIPTQRDLVAGEVAKDYALNFMLPDIVAKSHRDGLLHYHDLDYSPLFGSYNCQLGGFKSMLENGFKMGNAYITPPKGIQTAATVLCQAIAQVASCSYGGLTVNNIDLLLAPYAEMTYKGYLSEAEEYVDLTKITAEGWAKKKIKEAVYVAMKSVEYEVNTLHTANGQSPFSTLSFGLGTTFLERLIQESILKVRLKGLGKKRTTPTFPKLCFVLKRGHNLDKCDINYDMKLLALKCQRKRIYPDILNYDKVVEVTGNFKAPMGR